MIPLSVYDQLARVGLLWLYVMLHYVWPSRGTVSPPPPVPPVPPLLKRGQICFGASTFVQLLGKGRKERTVPLWPDTAQVVKGWFEELGEAAGPMAFPNARGKALSREGVDYLLQHARQRAISACPSLATKHLTPHVVRHTTAMHLLQAGVDIATIALWLGHESIDTTPMYLQADLAMQEKALEKLDPLAGVWKRFQADDPLLMFLNAL